MTNPVTFASAKSVICHGSGGLHLVDYTPGVKIWTGQKTVEDFDTPEACLTRYLELGGSLVESTTIWPDGKMYNPVTKAFIDKPDPDSIDEWTQDGTFANGAVVRHQGRYWLHISGDQGEPDDVYDIEAGTGDWIPVDRSWID